MQQIDLSRIDLNLLVVFEALIEERHVGRAAGRICLSQSATSHALGRLRRLFDDPLFVRHRTGVEPTNRAKDLARPLADALAQIRYIVGPPSTFDPATLARTLTIATHDYATVVLLGKVLARLRSVAPGVDLRCLALSYDELITGFDRGTIDLACGAMQGFDVRRIERTPLFEDEFVGVVRAAHPALRAGRITLEAFVEYPHIRISSGNEPRAPLDLALDAIGLVPRIGMTVPGALSIPMIVATSDLIGIVPRLLAAIFSRHPGLAAFDLPVATARVTCDLLMPRARAGSSELRWITSLFSEVAAEILAPSS